MKLLYEKTFFVDTKKEEKIKFCLFPTIAIDTSFSKRSYMKYIVWLEYVIYCEATNSWSLSTKN